jgi:hypothetical protein
MAEGAALFRPTRFWFAHTSSLLEAKMDCFVASLLAMTILWTSRG